MLELDATKAIDQRMERKAGSRVFDFERDETLSKSVFEIFSWSLRIDLNVLLLLLDIEQEELESSEVDLSFCLSKNFGCDGGSLSFIILYFSSLISSVGFGSFLMNFLNAEVFFGVKILTKFFLCSIFPFL